MVEKVTALRLKRRTVLRPAAQRPFVTRIRAHYGVTRRRVSHDAAVDRSGVSSIAAHQKALIPAEGKHQEKDVTPTDYP